MSLEDPFLIVQNEVFDALLKLRNNYTRWKDLEENPSDISREDYHAWVMELKNGIKSIQWDLDELEESLENGNHSARLDSTEFEKRRNFIGCTREEVKSMSEKITKSNAKPKGKADFPLNFDGSAASSPANQNGTKYMRLINAPDASAQGENILFKAPFDADDEQKSPYVPDHSITFDNDLSVNIVNSRQSRFERIKTALHITTERRQWMALGFVSTVFILIIIAAI
ncbi:Syntaxin-6 [Tyrophagus putrescentiae]|nr:Syntaxin-6 [Tyrophagus putrescentiae]